MKYNRFHIISARWNPTELLHHRCFVEILPGQDGKGRRVGGPPDYEVMANVAMNISLKPCGLIIIMLEIRSLNGNR